MRKWEEIFFPFESGNNGAVFVYIHEIHFFSQDLPQTSH